MNFESLHEARTTTARCVTCGRALVRKASERWKTRCLACWKASMTAAAERAAWAAGYEAGRRSAQALAAVEGIDKSRLRALLQLCHPDRHGGSALANSTTQWLLAMKGRA